MNKELTEHLNAIAASQVADYFTTGYEHSDAISKAADAIARLELEAVAATLRIENDALEIAKHCNCEFDGDVNTVQCKLHNAWAETLNEQATYRRERNELRAELANERDEVELKTACINGMRAAANSLAGERDALRAELEKIKAQEPIAWLNDHRTIAFTRFDLDGFPEDIRAIYTTPLYLAPGAQTVPEGWVATRIDDHEIRVVSADGEAWRLRSADRNDPFNNFIFRWAEAMLEAAKYKS